MTAAPTLSETAILKYVRVLDTTIKDMFSGDHEDRQAYLAQLEADEKAHLDSLIQESIEEQQREAVEQGWQSRYQDGRFARG